jgi:hypothetical protein
MRIRMLVQMNEGAARDGHPWPAEGEEIELPTAEAAHLVAAGVAEEVEASEEEATGQAPRRRKPRGGSHADGDGT